ncbi:MULTISPECIES: DUF1515 domain-containing protein [Rhizobium]|uniref:DUF1515 domain-containing protein n=1 Tax=Rhizobium TaxID=379 RepID=UPI001B32C30C|nr:MULTISPECIES: DUF1515 domain-containing protein [Rhizobium]MBX4911228.1 DUF1515 domain-containing protein [Rhizobium bangladeshense]MBX5260345.1 DUF1515 domain-containing protein [Rhizobium sp. NLR16b]MBX5266435.1 DUF1515 domain-containing protein [Rhizobium sp. NLR16a]MBX5315003.1 DUF1515 domain-containing protein [Rhizobium sp. NLR11b]QTU98138.1 DUF1515 domain-containing protein [Rhizobium sp. NLR16a]
MTSNDDILRALGRVEGRLTGIEESVALLRKDFGDEKEHAHESRAVIHQRLDEQQQRISRVDTTIAVSGEVEAMLRDQIKGLKETVDENHKAVKPTLDEWKRMKQIGYGISGLIAFAGLTVGGTVAYMSDSAVAWLRHWLKIN